MKLKITAQEIWDQGCWSEFCDLKGISVYAMNEGMDENTEFELTPEEAKDIGLVI